MSTNAISSKDIKRTWYLFDAKDQTLGRLSTVIAKVLMGKNKPSYVPYLDQGDFVVVTNVSKVKVTGRKSTQKVYFRHSGYPGGDKTETFAQLQNRKPEEIIRHAVKGMLPKNKLGRQMIKKLHLYPTDTHPYEKQIAGGIK